MTILKKLFCRHVERQVIYHNERPTKNLKYIEDYTVEVCLKCKRRILIVRGRNYFKEIRGVK